MPRSHVRSQLRLRLPSSSTHAAVASSFRRRSTSPIIEGTTRLRRGQECHPGPRRDPLQPIPPSIEDLPGTKAFYRGRRRISWAGMPSRLICTGAGRGEWCFAEPFNGTPCGLLAWYWTVQWSQRSGNSAGTFKTQGESPHGKSDRDRPGPSFDLSTGAAQSTILDGEIIRMYSVRAPMPLMHAYRGRHLCCLLGCTILGHGMKRHVTLALRPAWVNFSQPTHALKPL